MTPSPLKQEAQLSDKTGVNNTTTGAAYVSRTGPGQQLQIARENARITVEQVAAHLHLTAAIVSDLEHDRYDKGIPFTYIRGYLRTYARLVQISPDTVVKAFDQLGLEDQRREVKMPLKSVKRSLPLREGSMRWIIITIVALILIGGMVWWFNQPVETNPMQQDLLQLLNEINPEQK